jgi:hypothetical protein
MEASGQLMGMICFSGARGVRQGELSRFLIYRLRQESVAAEPPMGLSPERQQPPSGNALHSVFVAMKLRRPPSWNVRSNGRSMTGAFCLQTSSPNTSLT